MRIVVSAQGETLDAAASPVFGRCPIYIFVDTETMAFDAVPNPAMNQGGGAGIQAAQFVVERGADVVLTGNLGRAIIKVSAVDPAHHLIEAPARVFTDQDQVIAAFEADDFRLHAGDVLLRAPVGQREQLDVQPGPRVHTDCVVVLVIDREGLLGATLGEHQVDQGLRDRGAIHFDERRLGAPGTTVDLPGH